MSCFSQPELSHNSTIAKASQPTVLKPDMRSVLPASRAPANVLPFPPDIHNFTPKIDDVMRAFYGLPYGIPTAAVDPNPFYNLNPADRKDLPNVWRSPPTHAFSPYERSLASIFYAQGFPHLAMADSVRGRKNATRETTSVLKSWLDEHKKNPYPTKAEKVLLAVMSKMTLTQVSTWFANARRRLKKENKMTWPARNCLGDERDSGEENAERSYSISPRDMEAGIENRRLSPSKNEPTSPQMQEMNSAAASNGLSYQQYQQQMLLQQLNLLDPKLHTSEAMKQVKEQLQLRSRWAAAAASDSPVSVSNYALPAKIPIVSSEKTQERRNSVGSPSTSSYDRSPSPLHRPLQSSCVPPSTSNQSTPYRKSASVSDSPTNSLKMEKENDAYRPRTKSNEENLKGKSSIWSPVTMVSEKTPMNQKSLLHGQVSRGSEATSIKKEEFVKTSSLTNGKVAAINRSAFLQKEKLSPSAEAANFHANSLAYFREYQRQFATQTSMQHGLSTLMMPVPLDKTQSQLLEQLQQNPNLQSQLLFSKNLLQKETPCQQNTDSDAKSNNNDTPMNLSTSSRSMDLPMNLKEKKEFALNDDSAGAATV